MIASVSRSRNAVPLRRSSETARSRGATVTTGVSGASPASWLSPAARARISLRSARASDSGRNCSFTRESRVPATSTVTSAIEKKRATSGWATSTLCSRLSCSRRCCVVRMPESTRKSPSSSNQYQVRVQARYCQPATSAGTTMSRSRTPMSEVTPSAGKTPSATATMSPIPTGSALAPCTSGEIGWTRRRPDGSTVPLPGRRNPSPRSSPTADAGGGGPPAGSGGVGFGSVTVRPIATRRAGRDDREALPRRRAPGPGCSRPWSRPRCAAGPW